ncbi:MAG: small acid-soluble spore protein SspI [Longibaculum sp.]
MQMREALLTNLKGISVQDLQKTIDEGIASKEETILVGLGVLFEQYYNSLNQSSKQQFLQSLSSLL